jgi:hypothetical protein
MDNVVNLSRQIVKDYITVPVAHGHISKVTNATIRAAVNPKILSILPVFQHIGRSFINPTIGRENQELHRFLPCEPQF